MKHKRPHIHWRNVKRNTKGRRPILVNPAIKKITNKQYKQSMRTLAPFADADGDGVPNIKDCRPFDKKRQDEGDDMESAMERRNARMDETNEDYGYYEEVQARERDERRAARPGAGVSQKEAQDLMFNAFKRRKQ